MVKSSCPGCPVNDLCHLAFFCLSHPICLTLRRALGVQLCLTDQQSPRHSPELCQGLRAPAPRASPRPDPDPLPTAVRLGPASGGVSGGNDSRGPGLTQHGLCVPVELRCGGEQSGAAPVGRTWASDASLLSRSRGRVRIAATRVEEGTEVLPFQTPRGPSRTDRNSATRLPQPQGGSGALFCARGRQRQPSGLRVGSATVPPARLRAHPPVMSQPLSPPGPADSAVPRGRALRARRRSQPRSGLPKEVLPRPQARGDSSQTEHVLKTKKPTSRNISIHLGQV